AFTLSEDFDPDRIEAEMRGGVLTLTLPRAPEAQPKRIAVKGA
ncbi:Hsp20 family protein, partial [Paracoccus sp. PS-1]